LVGNRIPKDFFVISGCGQSDNTIHAGSYHLALKEAKIEMCNIMTYSSILPEIANEIQRPEKLIHGSVMESILSVCSVEKGEYGIAGLTYSWLFHRGTGKKYGGLVCEINGNFSLASMHDKLENSILELYNNGYSSDFILKTGKTIIQDIKPEKTYGTALVGLCFVNYIYPVLKGINNAKVNDPESNKGKS
jgi:arginine decarboxylase